MKVHTINDEPNDGRSVRNGCYRDEGRLHVTDVRRTRLVRRVERAVPLDLLRMVLLMNLLPCFRVNDEETLAGLFDGNRVLAREAVTVGLILIGLTILLGLRGQDSCSFRVEGIPVKEPSSKHCASPHHETLTGER
jgi:hypothetical protein